MQVLFFLLVLIFLCKIEPVSANSLEVFGNQDTYIEEKFPTTIPWEERNLYLGTDSLYAKGKTRILIKPDFAQLLDRNIAPTDIESVELVLTAYAYEGTNSTVTIDAYTTTSPWSMFTTTWNLQPTISSSKKNTTLISPQPGTKTITVTQAFIDIYKTYPVAENGIELKINAETEKAIIFWAHGCDLVTEPPICDGEDERPYFRVHYKDNLPPANCTLKSPTATLQNSATVKIEPMAVTDPEGNSVNYSGRICTDPACEAPIWQNSIKPSNSVSTDLPDGTYYASCLATDSYHEAEWGSIVNFEIDTQPPVPPQLIEEPPFTGTSENAVTWVPIQESGVLYQVLFSERKGFTSYNTYSPWLTGNNLLIPHTKEKAFYYKVRAKDRAGNESEWSASTSTIIDTSFPTVKYFKTNKTLLSPKTTKNGDVTENAYIQGGVDDATIEEIWLEVTTTINKLVYSEKVEEKNYLWTHWPDKVGYSDGQYILTLYASDSVQNRIQSDAIIIVLDTKPPAPPIISGIRNKQILIKQRISLAVTCPAQTLATVYLSGKIIAYGKDRHLINFTKTDGNYTLSATCTDLVGNKSKRTLSFTIDAKPPSIPILTYKFDEAKKQITLSSYCRENGSITFFQQGVIIQQASCKKSTYATYLLPEAIQLPYFTVFNAKAQDASGNSSDLGELTKYLTDKSTQTKVSTILCSASYEMISKNFKNISCVWKPIVLSPYQGTLPHYSTTYISSFGFAKDLHAKTVISVLSCKKRSLWDPRTWWSCVTEISQEMTLDNKIIPVVSTDLPVKNYGANSLKISHGRISNITIKERIYLHLSTIIGDSPVAYDYFSPEIQRTHELTYKVNKNRAYFSWLFASPKNVSQWHGYTAFQKPHGGIDFSVAEERILAPAPGKVISSGYAKQNSCNAGGNYLGIKHPNGLYTYYFHLASTKYPSGKLIKIGNSINTGQALAKTGNSGMYNCEPLASHLHFELRTTWATSSHVNPVPYFSVDWNSIATAKASTYPGRLSGDNPHPKF